MEINSHLFICIANYEVFAFVDSKVSSILLWRIKYQKYKIQNHETFLLLSVITYTSIMCFF